MWCFRWPRPRAAAAGRALALVPGRGEPPPCVRFLPGFTGQAMWRNDRRERVCVGGSGDAGHCLALSVLLLGRWMRRDRWADGGGRTRGRRRGAVGCPVRGARSLNHSRALTASTHLHSSPSPSLHSVRTPPCLRRILSHESRRCGRPMWVPLPVCCVRATSRERLPSP